MRRITWNDLLVGFTIMHLGQQLGSDTRLARAVSELVHAAASFFDLIS